MKITEGYVFVFDFREMAASFSSSLGWALDCIFHWCARQLIYFKSELRVFWEFLGSIIFEKSEVSSNLTYWHNPVYQLIHVYISRTKADLILTSVVHQNLFFPNLKFDHLKQPFVFDLSDNIPIKAVIHLQLLFEFNFILNRRPLCQTLFNVLKIFKNTSLTSTVRLISKVVLYFMNYRHKLSYTWIYW